jgi:transcriptional regulator with XRE-family HTH domain
MTPAQCRAARALINMTINELAAKAVVPTTTVWNYEAGFAAPNEANLRALQQALENAGVEFIEGGVRLGKAK